MLALRLLGGLALDNPGGAPLGRAAQRRRLALLAILASPAGMAVAREKLLGMLWPEVPPDDARHRLSVALYDLRGALGADALTVTPQDVVLKPDAIATDVAAFEAALARGDAADAIARYGGPFLDGVYLVDAPEFERWTDLRRAALERAYAGALEQLALQRENEGASAAAAEVWRRLLELDPYSAGATLGLMRALDAAGDRAGAMRQALAHAELLRRDLDAEPDPAVEQLAAEIRQGRQPVNGPHATTASSSSGVPEAAAPARAAVEATAPAPRLARVRKGALVAGVILVAAAGLSLARNGLAGRDVPAAAGSAEEAFRAGEVHMRAGRFDAAVDAYTRAVAQDSLFALAHFRLAVATLWADRPGSFLDTHVASAVRRAHRLGERDALLLSAFVEWRRGNASTAEAINRRALAFDSTSAEAWHQLGETLFHYHPIRGLPIAQARAAFDEAVRRDSQHFGALWHLAQLAALDGRADDVRLLTDRLLALGPDAVRELEVRLFRAAALRDGRAFDDTFERLRAADPSLLFGIGWRLAVFARAHDEAGRVLTLLTEATRPPQVRALGTTQLLYLDIAAGRPSAALARLRQLGGLASADEVDALTALLPAIMLAHAGSTTTLYTARDSMAVAADRVGDAHAADRLVALVWADLVLGDTAGARTHAQRLDDLARAEGAPNAAGPVQARAALGHALIALYLPGAAAVRTPADQVARGRWFGDAASNLLDAQTLERFVYAGMLRKAGRSTEADMWLAGLGAHVPADLALHVPALLLRAEMAREHGDSAAARTHCDHANALWSAAESVMRYWLERAPACM